MVIKVDYRRYSKKVLKRLEQQLKESKYDWEKELLRKEIERHKERYVEYL